MYTENYSTVEKLNDLHKSKGIVNSWILKLNTIKMEILPKSIYRFNAISIKIPVVFEEMDKLILK